jgi:hypothetical protein
MIILIKIGKRYLNSHYFLNSGKILKKTPPLLFQRGILGKIVYILNFHSNNFCISLRKKKKIPLPPFSKGDFWKEHIPYPLRRGQGDFKKNFFYNSPSIVLSLIKKFLIKYYLKLSFLFLILFTITACDLFSTRSPEEPNTGKSSNQPATSPSIVISNFIYSIEEKNTQNYLSCLLETGESTTQSYNFIPSSEALAQYFDIFKDWGIDKERQYFTNFLTKINTEVAPSLVLSNDRFDVLLPDSAVYIANYKLIISPNIQSLQNEYLGTLQFTIIPNNTGLWNISKWTDISITVNDTLKPSWSFLKAQLSN